MGKPLAGIKVIEIAQEIQGPFAGLFLSDLGAEMTKVENRETGDLSRWLLAGLIGGPDVKNADVSHYFIAMNRGKRSITVDLKKKQGIEVVRRLAQLRRVARPTTGPAYSSGSDSAMKIWRKINPRIIFAQGSSWGPSGHGRDVRAAIRWRKRPAA